MHETDYKRLRNRCPNCGHRLVMREVGTLKCAVVNGDGPKLETLVPCKCRKHYRR